MRVEISEGQRRIIDHWTMARDQAQANLQMVVGTILAGAGDVDPAAMIRLDGNALVVETPDDAD